MVKKRLQNRIAGSRLALPAALAYAIVVWLLGGLIQENRWVQFGLFVLAIYVMAQMNNVNALIRIYSRMVSCSFIAMSCAACFLFPSLRDGFIQLCYAGTITLLFMTYQDKQGSGLTFYAYTLLGMAAIADIRILYFVPVMWLLTATQLQSLSGRTLSASILGILMPFWVMSCWMVWNNGLSSLPSLVAQWDDFGPLLDFTVLSTSQVATWGLVAIAAITGTIHYIRKHRDDRIRTRLLFGFLIWMDLVTVLFLMLQPQLSDMLTGLAIINTAPLIGHFIALTSTRYTNIYCGILLAATLLLTIYNLWTI